MFVSILAINQIKRIYVFLFKSFNYCASDRFVRQEARDDWKIDASYTPTGSFTLSFQDSGSSAISVTHIGIKTMGFEIETNCSAFRRRQFSSLEELVECFQGKLFSWKTFELLILERDLLLFLFLPFLVFKDVFGVKYQLSYIWSVLSFSWRSVVNLDVFFVLWPFLDSCFVYRVFLIR